MYASGLQYKVNHFPRWEVKTNGTGPGPIPPFEKSAEDELEPDSACWTAYPDPDPDPLDPVELIR